MFCDDPVMARDDHRSEHDQEQHQQQAKGAGNGRS
jgi:hypothetical protein